MEEANHKRVAYHHTRFATTSGDMSLSANWPILSHEIVCIGVSKEKQLFHITYKPYSYFQNFSVNQEYLQTLLISNMCF